MLRTVRKDERGASEVLGVVLLLGLVAIASIAVILSGSPGIEAVQGQTDEEQAETILQEFDSRVSSLTASDSTTQARFDLGETNPSQFGVSDGAWMNVTINEQESCAANIRMGSVAYEDGNTEVGYQAGGVWNRFSGGNSTMVAEPEVVYRDGSIEMDLTNVSGNLDKTENELAVTSSSVPSNDITRGDCVRPDNVTISVKSRYYQAWGRYLESEFGTTATTDDSSQTAEIYLEQSDLPERVNDSRNNVVNLSDSGATVNADSIKFDKGAGNRYTVSATPVGNGSIDIGSTRKFTDNQNISRRPIDVMFLIDDTGSMDRDPEGNGIDKYDEATAAAERFVGQLNESRDRAGVIAFEADGKYILTDNNEYISGNFGPNGVNGSIQGTPGSRGVVGSWSAYGTDTTPALNDANRVLELQSNQTRNRAIVLLTDGANDDLPYEDSDACQPVNGNAYTCERNRESLDAANDSGANGISIYTVGYGEGGLNEPFLDEVADLSDGEDYRATDADELNSVFDDIRKDLTETDTITRWPIASNYTTGSGEVYPPGSAGDLDDVADEEVNGNEFKNINDPTVGAQFSHSFAVKDERVEFRVHEFECAEDGWVGTGRYESNDDGENYQIVRCSDIKADTTSTIRPDSIHLDGDNIASQLRDGTQWWQDINDSFNRSDIDVCQSTTCDDGARSFGDLELNSNQALVHYNFKDDNDEPYNRLYMLYEIGIAESNAEAADVINIEVNNVSAAS